MYANNGLDGAPAPSAEDKGNQVIHNPCVADLKIK
jgi:hypothetical protein